MDFMQKTAIIVPCYNEANRLDGPAFAQFAKVNKIISFFFVNDGSTDRTAEILHEICTTNPTQMRCIDFNKNLGKAEAVRQGSLEALKEDFVNIGYWDADLATPLRSIDAMCSCLESSDTAIVIGSRVRLLGRKIKRRALRHYLGRLFATLASMLLRLPIYDTQCGAKIFRKSDDLKKALKIPFKVKWTFDVELLARFILIKRGRKGNDVGARWVEYPLEEWTDVKGSKVGYLDFLKIGTELAKLFFLLYIPAAHDRYTRAILS